MGGLIRQWIARDDLGELSGKSCRDRGEQEIAVRCQRGFGRAPGLLHGPPQQDRHCRAVSGVVEGRARGACSAQIFVEHDPRRRNPSPEGVVRGDGRIIGVEHHKRDCQEPVRASSRRWAIAELRSGPMSVSDAKASPAFCVQGLTSLRPSRSATLPKERPAWR